MVYYINSSHTASSFINRLSKVSTARPFWKSLIWFIPRNVTHLIYAVWQITRQMSVYQPVFLILSMVYKLTTGFSGRYEYNCIDCNPEAATTKMQCNSYKIAFAIISVHRLCFTEKVKDASAMYTIAHTSVGLLVGERRNKDDVRCVCML